MPYARSGGELCVDGVRLTDVADAVGTPAYVYSWQSVQDAFEAVRQAFGRCGPRVCYAVKANSNLSLLSRLAVLGAGFDIVSAGELERVLRAGGDPSRVVFSGVGKTCEDVDFGIKCGIDTFNVESAPELERIAARARLLGRRARVSVRVNPDVDAGAHPYIATGLKASKFGVRPSDAVELLRRAAASPDLDVVGVACHIGSQVAAVAPYLQALSTLLDIVDELAGEGLEIDQVDLGGGFGIRYQDEAVLDVAKLGEAVRAALGERRLTLVVEPGRCLVAAAGVLLTRVEYLKPSADEGAPNFAVVDAAMNDLLRPALYGAWHRVEAVADGGAPGAAATSWHVVGPVCESGDFLARDRRLAIAEGSLLAVRDAGAYGFVQSSNYNSRGRAAEVLVDGDRFLVARRRETASDLLRLETLV